MTVTLRRFAPADLAALHEIDQVCYEPGIAYSRRELRWYLAQPDADCLVAESDGQIAGFILAHRQDSRAHIITIDVLEGWRRRRIGSSLLLEAERRLAAAGVRVIELETATANEGGVAFWLRHGYRTVGLLKGYYLGRVDAYAMCKILPAAA